MGGRTQALARRNLRWVELSVRHEHGGHISGPLVPGTGIHTGPGQFRWATVTAAVHATVERVGDHPWVEVLTLPDLIEDPWLRHVWVHHSDLRGLQTVAPPATRR